jgi:ABC-type Fe3+ transport system substrate-binding protein
MGASMSDIELFRRQGLKQIEAITPSGAPGTLVGSYSVLKQTKNSPHPNAATVFINWYASKPGQLTYSEAMNEPSRRTDITELSFPSYLLSKPGFEYIDQYEENWYQTVRNRIQEQVTKALGGQ